MQSCISSDPRRGLGILNNQLYIGRYVWNRTEWVKNTDPEKKSTHLPYAHDKQDWVRPLKVHESLRIIKEALWTACGLDRRSNRTW
jgi:site-specific DNA recombinase